MAHRATMTETEQEGCAEAKRLRQIDDAFVKGDLEVLRAAVDDPAPFSRQALTWNCPRESMSMKRRCKWLQALAGARGSVPSHAPQGSGRVAPYLRMIVPSRRYSARSASTGST